MPKPGYTCITVSKTLYTKLKTLAQTRNLTIPDLIEQLANSTSTFMSSTSTNPPKKTTQTATLTLEYSSNRSINNGCTRGSYSPGEIRTPVGGSKGLHAYQAAPPGYPIIAILATGF